MKKIKFSNLFISIIFAELVGLLSNIFSGNQKEIYSSLKLPALSPPNWAFPVVWTILYALMGIAAYLIYDSQADSISKKRALSLYGVQLLFNFLWSIVFFGFQSIGLSLMVIIILTILVLLTFIAFYKINKIAGYLFIPYLIWILFATYLNIAIFLLN